MGGSRKAFDRVGKKQCFIMKTKTKVGVAVISVIVAISLGGVIASASASQGGKECGGPKENKRCQNNNTNPCSDLYGCKSTRTVSLYEEVERMGLDW